MSRYPPHGRRASPIETGVTWDRLRAPAIDTSPHDLHISDCLNDLQPGDHVEIQWRRNKEFPYGIFQLYLEDFVVVYICYSAIHMASRLMTDLERESLA